MDRLAGWSGLTELEKVERSAISEALLAANGDRVQAAALLGIGRAMLYRKLRLA